MKLYEFMYSDKQNLSESAVLERVKTLLLVEGENQGWAPGYKFQQCKEIEHTVGEKKYLFEVTGRFLKPYKRKA
jgi:hypothetical protein